MDLDLSPEHRALRDTARKWVDEVVVPDALRNDREERFPAEALDGLRTTGFIGLTIPEEYGGGGADPLSYVLVIEELGRGDANVRSIVSVHLGLVAGSIARWGTDEQRQRWLPAMAAGETLGCFALTEPDHGSDPANLRATAERTTSGWRCPAARSSSRTARSPALHWSWRVRVAPAPAVSAPFSCRRVRRASTRGRSTASWGSGRVTPPRSPWTASRSVRTPCSAVSRGAGSRSRCRRSTTAGCRSPRPAPGWRRPPSTRCSPTQARQQFGKPIAAHQLVQELIADTAVDVDAARLLTWRVADLKTRGERYSLAASKAKLFATEASVRAANACVQAHGGYGYIDEYPAGEVPARRPGHDAVRGHQPDPEAAHRARPDRHLRLHLTGSSRSRDTSAASTNRFCSNPARVTDSSRSTSTPRNRWYGSVDVTRTASRSAPRADVAGRPRRCPAPAGAAR